MDGGGLAAMLAQTGNLDLPIVRWENLFLATEQGCSMQRHDDTIAVAGCLMSLINAVQENKEPT